MRARFSRRTWQLTCAGLAALCIAQCARAWRRLGALGGASAGSVVLFSPLRGVVACDGDDECLQAERNAVASWSLLHSALAPMRLHIVAFVEHMRGCDPRVAALPGVACVAAPQCVHAATGVPTVNCAVQQAFAHAQRLTGHREHVYVLVNSDIIFTASLGAALRRLAVLHARGFVLVGRRVDTPLQNLRFDTPQETVRVAALVRHVSGVNHSVFGLDYFAFPHTAFPSAFPPFLFGRFRWDNVLALELLASGLPVVDGSSSVECIHPGYTENASNPNHVLRMGARVNAALAKAHSGDAHLLGRIDNAPWALHGVCPRCVLAPQEPKTGWGVVAYTRAHRQTRALAVACVCDADGVDSAVHWATRAHAARLHNYVLFAFDTTALHLLLARNVSAALFTERRLLSDSCATRRTDLVHRLLRFNVAAAVVLDERLAWSPALRDDFFAAPRCTARVLVSRAAPPIRVLAVSLRPTDEGRAAWRAFMHCQALGRDACSCAHESFGGSESCWITDNGAPHVPPATCVVEA